MQDTKKPDRLSKNFLQSLTRQIPSLPSTRHTRTELLIDALADDVARWQQEAMQYRAVAQEAIHEVHRLRQECDQLREQLQALRDELRRYIASQVKP